jgi:hypothetical protein
VEGHHDRGVVRKGSGNVVPEGAVLVVDLEGLPMPPRIGTERRRRIGARPSVAADARHKQGNEKNQGGTSRHESMHDGPPERADCVHKLCVRIHKRCCAQK